MMKSRKMYYRSNLNTASYPKQGVSDWRLSRLTSLLPSVRHAWQMMLLIEVDVVLWQNGWVYVGGMLVGVNELWMLSRRVVDLWEKAELSYKGRLSRPTQTPSVNEACFTDDEAGQPSFLHSVRRVLLMMKPIEVNVVLWQNGWVYVGGMLIGVNELWMLRRGVVNLREKAELSCEARSQESKTVSDTEDKTPFRYMDGCV